MRVAAVDIGTNSVRLLVARKRPADLFGADRLEVVDRRVTVTRLGSGVDRSGRLSGEAVARTIDVLEGYGAVIDALRVDAADAVATSATRDAANRDEFLDRAELALGFRPRVISGVEEAEYSFRGATSDFTTDAGYLVIDPGGGSTEFVSGTDGVEAAVSIDIGSVRLTERLLPSLPAAADALEAAVDHVAGLFAGVQPAAVGTTVLGVGGTYTSLAAILLALPEYDPTSVHGSRHTLSDLRSLVRRLAGHTLEELRRIPSLDPARAPVLVGGAVVAAGALAAVGSDTVVVSEADILHGVALGAE